MNEYDSPPVTSPSTMESMQLQNMQQNTSALEYIEQPQNVHNTADLEYITPPRSALDEALENEYCAPPIAIEKEYVAPPVL